MGIQVFPQPAGGTSTLTQSQVSDVVRWTQIATTTTGGSGTITFSSIPSGYKAFKLAVIGLYAAVNNNGGLTLRLNNDSGSVYGRSTIRLGHNAGSTIDIGNSSEPNGNSIRLNINNTSEAGNSSFAIEISGNETSNNGKMVQWYGSLPEFISGTNLGYYLQSMSNAVYVSTSEINRIDLIQAGTTLAFATNGRIILYGAK